MADKSFESVDASMVQNDDLTVGDIFEDLVYGPAPESSATAEAWLDEHDRRFGLFINNEWSHPSGATYRTSVCPATKEPLCETIEGTNADMDTAVAAAKAAQEKWAALEPHVRAKHLYAIARHVQKHHRLLAVIESLDNGKSIRETRDADIPLVARHFYYHAGWAQLMETEMAGYTPVGVVGAIVPWNFPLMLLAWKVAPALAMGNTVVLKTASYTRLSALLFAEICAEAGLPPGVINIVTSPGRVGSYLADHPDVDKVAFTGSTPVGRLLRQRTAGSGKKISLELGGKSPMIVLDSADLDNVVEGVVNAIWFNQGQVCCAGSRLLIQENIFDELIRKLKRRMDTMRMGHPLDKCIDMGALVDESQFTTITGFVERAQAEGAEVYHAQIDVPTDGWYYPPTLVTNVQPVSECVREEIFGPVLVAYSFRDAKEAVKLANNTMFGLAGSVWTEDINLGVDVATQIKAGAIWINAHNMFDAAAGFGGYRESGFGRDGGKEGLMEYVLPAFKEAARPNPPLNFPTTEEDIVWDITPHGRPASVTSSNAAVDQAILGVDRVDRTQKVFIGGKQARPDGHYSQPIYDPQGNLISEVADSNRKDVRNAVEAARKAQSSWGKRAAHNRAQICFYVAENLMRRSDEFASRLQVQTGRDLADCEEEVRKTVSVLFYFASYADKYGGTVQETPNCMFVTCLNEPVGVVGILCPDEYPLLSFVTLTFAALCRGNSVVVVPSEAHPLCATDLYQVFETSDLSLAVPGAVNILTGSKHLMAKHLSEHYNVDAVWCFTHGNHSDDGAQLCRNVEWEAGINMKRTLCDYAEPFPWFDVEAGVGKYLLFNAIEPKNIWVPAGEGII